MWRCIPSDMRLNNFIRQELHVLARKLSGVARRNLHMGDLELSQTNSRHALCLSKRERECGQRYLDVVDVPMSNVL